MFIFATTRAARLEQCLNPPRGFGQRPYPVVPNPKESPGNQRQSRANCGTSSSTPSKAGELGTISAARARIAGELAAAGSPADQLRSNRPRIEAALRAWHLQFGRPASTTDLSISYATRAARRDGGVRLRRLTHGWEGGRWPAPSVVQYHYGTLDNANRESLGGAKETPQTARRVWDGKPHLPSQTPPNPTVSDGIRLIQKGAPCTSHSGPTDT